MQFVLAFSVDKKMAEIYQAVDLILSDKEKNVLVYSVDDFGYVFQ